MRMHGNRALKSGVRSRLLVIARCRISGAFVVWDFFPHEDALFMVLLMILEEKHLPDQLRQRANPFMTCLCNTELRSCGGCLQRV